MITWNSAIAILVLLFAITASAPGYAVAEPPVPDWEHVSFSAVLYETTENLSMKALERGRRKATSELLGFAQRGSPLCPETLVAAVEPRATYCTLNATGSDSISLLTGRGNFGGDVEVVVQEIVDETTQQITPDSPEVVMARGRFTGKMDFSPAIVGVPDGNGGTLKLPLGTVKGHLSLDGFAKRVPFTGVFRLPFVPAAGAPPMYLLDDGVVSVLPNEMAIGYPTVRFEISF
jgi:hypothetical protein